MPETWGEMIDRQKAERRGLAIGHRHRLITAQRAERVAIFHQVIAEAGGVQSAASRARAAEVLGMEADHFHHLLGVYRDA